MPRFQLLAVALAASLPIGCGSTGSDSLFGGGQGTGNATGGAASTQDGAASSSGGSSSGSGGANASGGAALSASGGTDSDAHTTEPPPTDAGAKLPLNPACVPGQFNAKLIGKYQTAATILPATLDLDLPLDVNLTASADAGFLDLDATGSGNYGLTPVVYTGHITGRIDCRTGFVVDGELSGNYGTGFGNTPFQGPVAGSMDFQTSVLSGTWQAKESNPQYGGNGTWVTTN